MEYEVRGRGGLYPEGVSFGSATAAGAIERYQAVRAACGTAEVFVKGRRVRRFDLVKLARTELTDSDKVSAAAASSTCLEGERSWRRSSPAKRSA